MIWRHPAKTDGERRQNKCQLRNVRDVKSNDRDLKVVLDPDLVPSDTEECLRCI